MAWAAKPVAQLHVIVALVDNAFQGIVPVPAKIGNGDDAFNNLYWGAAFGVKTFFNSRAGLDKSGMQQRCVQRNFRALYVYLFRQTAGDRRGFAGQAH